MGSGLILTILRRSTRVAMSVFDSLDFDIFHSVAEINPDEWDRLSAGRPFTSHRWYAYGETVMADCEPTYLIASQHRQPIARATFWRSSNEPLPIESALLRRAFEPIFRRWPLLICRSPLTSVSGLVLPETPLRKTAQTAFSAKAEELLKQTGCSFLIFDYLSKDESMNWSGRLIPMTIPEPGTAMDLPWPSFEAWLQAGNKKDRQHYKRTLREAEKLGIQVSRHKNLEHLDIEGALALIQNVEHRFGSAENPWARKMIEHFNMVEGATFLTASIGQQLVGCGLVLEDNGAQTNTLLGLDKKVPYVYFMLVYESLKIAFEHNIRLMRLGSGSYEVKQQLGFSIEDNNSLLFRASNILLQRTGQWLEKHAG